MKTTNTHLNDEHMQMYEWSGLGAGAAGAGPAGSKRSHSWHASYGVLAVLTTFLILNGCDKQTAAGQASEQIGQAAQGPADPRAEPQLFDDTAPEAAAPAAEIPSTPAAGEVPPGEETPGVPAQGNESPALP